MHTHACKMLCYMAGLWYIYPLPNQLQYAVLWAGSCLHRSMFGVQADQNQPGKQYPPSPPLPSPLSLPLPSPPLPFPLLSSLPSPSPPPFLPLQSSSLFPSLIVHSCSGGDGVLGLCPLSSQFGPHQRHEALLWKGGEERGRAARTSSLCRPQEEPPTVLTKRWRACYIVQVMKLFTFYRGARHGTPEFWESLLARTASTSAWQGHVHPSIHRLRNLCHVKKNH